jgi:hypothetical protein
MSDCELTPLQRETNRFGEIFGSLSPLAAFDELLCLPGDSECGAPELGIGRIKYIDK